MGDPVICCLLGICCPPAEQRAAWVRLFKDRAGLEDKGAESATDAVLLTLAPVLEALRKLAQILRGGA